MNCLFNEFKGVSNAGIGIEIGAIWQELESCVPTFASGKFALQLSHKSFETGGNIDLSVVITIDNEIEVTKFNWRVGRLASGEKIHEKLGVGLSLLNSVANRMQVLSNRHSHRRLILNTVGYSKENCLTACLNECLAGLNLA